MEKQMMNIIQKLRMIFIDSYIVFYFEINQHSNRPDYRHSYKIYISNYKFKDSRNYFTPEYTNIKDLNDYLKLNVEGYKKVKLKK